MTAAPHVGRSLRRPEDDLLVRGAGRYLDDLPFEGLLHVAFARSPLAHAQITGLDTAEAAAAPGVGLVLTGSDVAGLLASPRPRPDRRVPPRPALVSDVVRMVGDPVAAVVADTAVAARDAAMLIFADYEPLPVAGDPEAALGAGATPVYPEYGDNVAFDRHGGDVAALRAMEGPVVVTGTVEHPRVVPAPMETRGVVAAWAGDRLTMWLGTQAPALMADELAAAFDIPVDQVRVVVPFMGGAFGCKYDLAEEEVLVAEAARRLGRPVKWVESRREHMLVIGHGRGQRHHYRAVAGEDGTLRSLYIESIVDVGARKRYIAGPPYTPRIGTGNYVVGEYAWRQVGAFTNRAPTGIYRGAGRPEATLTIERVMDRLATATGLDPAEVRRRNFVTKFPYKSPGGAEFDSGDYHRALDLLLEEAGYAELRRRQAELRDQGRYLGIGLCAYVEATAFERFERAVVEVDDQGRVVAKVGTLDHGQGHRTAFAQVVADRLGVDPEQVEVVQGDTAVVPWGFGTSGSRSAAHGGGSVAGAAGEVAAKAARIAAHLLEADPADIVLAGGRLEVRGAGGVGVSWPEVAAAAHNPVRLPPGEEPGLAADHKAEFGGLAFPFGMHLALVEVESDTGVVHLQEAWAVDDCGTVINPMLAEGQRHGGLAQGIGQALGEEAVYDEDGNPVSATFMDYVLLKAADMPVLHLSGTVTPTPHNELGAKGIAESGTIGIPAAIVNAVVDALTPFGIDHVDLPLHPERIWRAINRP